MTDSSLVINNPPDQNGIYKKPIYYSLIHILIGLAASKYHQLGILFILYQLSQLIINRRLFLFQLKLKKGNSISHTSYKLGEFYLGLIIGYLIL